MDGALTHSLMTVLIAAEPSCARAPQILHPINISKPAGRRKTKGQLPEIKPRASSLAACTLTTEPQIPTALTTQAISL